MAKKQAQNGPESLSQLDEVKTPGAVSVKPSEGSNVNKTKHFGDACVTKGKIDPLYFNNPETGQRSTTYSSHG